MSRPASAIHESDWDRLARKVRRRINAGWWLQISSGPLLVTGVAGSGAALFVRRSWPEIPQLAIAAAGVVFLILVLGISYGIASRRFEKNDESLVRLETALSLKNALSTARAGVAPWPALPVAIPGFYRWHRPRVILPAAGALVFFAAGFLVPLSVSPSVVDAPPQPQAWQKISDELDLLAKEEIADEAYLEETRKRLEELKAQEEDQWFSHGSLEATDALRQSHRAETKRASEEMNQAAKALEGLQKKEMRNPGERERLAGEFEKAVEGLRNGAMKPNSELLQQLGQIDPHNLGQLSQEQLDQLQKNLRQNAQQLNGLGNGEDWSEELASGENGEGEGDGNGEGDGDHPGKGGIDRGPGHDPDVIGKTKNRTTAGDLTALESKDLSRATTGDLLEIQNGEHQVDSSASKITQGGTIENTGKGGDQIWKQSLDPAEQRVYKKFFD